MTHKVFIALVFITFGCKQKIETNKHRYQGIIVHSDDTSYIINLGRTDTILPDIKKK